MRKGQQQLLAKARKQNFSDKKIAYLNSDEPLWYLNEVYTMLQFYSDEELLQYHIFQELLDSAKQYLEYANINSNMSWSLSEAFSYIIYNS